MKKIKRALISVYYKDGLEPILRKLNELGVEIYSTGGTFNFIRQLGIRAFTIESLTDYPSILGGRVKTLHPSIFGGILARRDQDSDKQQLIEHNILEFDLVIVDLYPFGETVENTNDEQQIIEKIDIGGISLIRAAAKNFNDVVVIAGRHLYTQLLDLLDNKNGVSNLEDRKNLAAEAYNISSHYDTAIFNYFNKDSYIPVFKESFSGLQPMRYGENPHQQGVFFGNLKEVFEQLHGKEISYNNLADLDAAIALVQEFDEPTFAIIKHTNACGLATRDKLIAAWKDALACDPISAFGGVLITNQIVDTETAQEINSLFFEVILAPGYAEEGLNLLKFKKNRIILRQKSFNFKSVQFKSALNGVLWQEKDMRSESIGDLKLVTHKSPSDEEVADLLWANKVVKHTKSNAIVLAKNKQLFGSGTGQTSRVDATIHAIGKAKSFAFNLHGAVMASDAFFPFTDSIELAYKSGITAVIQPGGSVRDQESIDFCNEHNLVMVFTGHRHFRH
ncbi:MAG: bifunctional phosphoribosylaminoimidazolecarboxamide formyltransferase/IMP cyclohydrolase [Bacteroidales bacterium]|nr:bifunctional phosphoribosylaminoimidazolecarboxamide formyltransferase/IMP cyclohydrolase [Bacteroidales bacterium]MDZ4205200.1 bifunctional phosphoribosylaminoimidazolecarboxamide formyltransferase/IMP cyclohydrolase [Bacteroidales bacterium]